MKLKYKPELQKQKPKENAKEQSSKSSQKTHTKGKSQDEPDQAPHSPAQTKIHWPNEGGPICGATSKRKNLPCTLPAGFRTNHVGSGRCWLHGGRSQGPKSLDKHLNNTFARKSGAHSKVFHDFMSEEEQEIYDNLVTDKLHLLTEEIRLITIRERRMMERIADLAEVDYSIVEMAFKDGIEKGQFTETIEEKATGTLGQIQQIEEGLTRVQLMKARLIELKHKFEEGGENGIDSLKDLVKAIKESG